MLPRLLPLLLFVGLAAGETITLRDGTVLEGKFFGGDSQHMRFVIDGKMRTFFLEDVALVAIGAPLPTKEPECPEVTCPPPPECPAVSSNESAQEPEEPQEPLEIADGVVPRGTPLLIRLREPVDSAEDPSGTVYHGILDKPVRVQGRTILPQGVPAELELVLGEETARGGGQFGLAVTAVVLDGQTVPVRTSQAGLTEDEKKKISLGSIARGAARVGRTIGGRTGSRAGRTAEDIEETAEEVSVGGHTVQVPADTVLRFHLLGDLRIATE